MDTMDTDRRKDLVTRHVDEVVTEEELEEILETKKKPIAYLGWAPTGMMHIGHFTLTRKIADFLKADFRFKFLIADIHAELDVEKTPLDLVEARSEYYEEAVRAMVEASGIDLDNVEFIRGSDFQHEKEYQKGYMHLMENATVNRAERASSEVVRHEESMKASGILYPFMQIMDCVALDVDIAYAGTDQRRIYMLGRETLPEMGEDKITCIFSPLLSGLTGSKMSASDEKSKIGIHDKKETVRKKINDAYCPEGQVENNGVLEYLKYLVFPIIKKKDKDFKVKRPEKYGGNLTYDSYGELENDFVSEDLHPQDLKEAASKHIFDILKPVKKRFEDREELLKRAYPEEYDVHP